ncbi:MAG TPA: class I SAM-dependent methyltransferase [Acidimicrobiales bacterium]|nr:class I SAM-dependent methyltransferase [Acidimicrobiales bacterium]
MNAAHLEVCASPEWKAALRDDILPFALRDAQLGDDVLEVGSGPGMTTDLLREEVPKLTCCELDEDLARSLAERLAGTNVEVVNADATDMPFEDGRFTGAVSFNMLHHVPTADLQDRLLADVARVLRPGAVFVACDGLPNPDLEAFHEGDTYNPLELGDVAPRLEEAGFRDVEVRSNEYGWAAQARR